MDYLKLMNVIAWAEQRNGIAELGVVTKTMLRFILERDVNSAKVRMTDLRRFGSFPTVQNHVERLISGGWIERCEDDNDRRIVVLRPQPKAMETMKAITDDLYQSPELVLRDDVKSGYSAFRRQTLTEVASLFEEFRTRFLKRTEIGE